MAYDLKTSTVVISGITDTSVIFGAKDGQADAAPDPISAPAVRQYVLEDAPALVSGGTHGDVLYRGAAAWEALAPGTAGRVLATQGPGADPSWVTGPATAVPDPLFLEEGISVDYVTPGFGGGIGAADIHDSGNHRIANFSKWTDSADTVPSFTNESTVTITMYALHGQATQNFIQAKKTFLPLNIGATYQGSGQKFALGSNVTSFSMGDTAAFAAMSVNYAGGPVSGDEGQGFGLFSALYQQQFLALTTIVAVPSTCTYNTTTTQIVLANINSQTITVASTVGAVVGDWIVIDQAVTSSSPRLEPVQIEAVGAGTITGKFIYNHDIGATIKPALVLDVTATFLLGQDRFLVNLSSASVYNTGTASGAPPGTSGALTGSGTNWTEGMVGGDALNIGAITLEVDDYKAAPFGTDDPLGPVISGNPKLRSWFKITSVNSTTSLGIHSFTVANDTSYKGRSNGVLGAYTIRPAAKVLKITRELGTAPNGFRILCEHSTHTWTPGDILEQAICCYPDTAGFQYSLGQWTPCGTQRSFMGVYNRGGQRYDSAYSCETQGPIANTPGVNGIDTVGWNTCFAGGNCLVGLRIFGAKSSALEFDMDSGLAPVGPTISWGSGAAYLDTVEFVSAGSGSNGFKWKMITDGGPADLNGVFSSHASAVPGTLHTRLRWSGALQTWPQPASFLPPADATHQGCIATVTNCNTQVWGATVAGGGAFTVLAFCNGTAWTVMAI